MTPEKAKLDRTRPFGLVYGSPGIAFEQDGVHFSGNEKPVEQWTTAEQLEMERVNRQKRLEREAILAQRRQAAANRKRAQEDQ